MQGQIWVAELDDSDFYAYAERMPPVSIRTPRDDKFILALRAAVSQFVVELEEWTDRARSLGVFQAFAEIVMPVEKAASIRRAARLRLGDWLARPNAAMTDTEAMTLANSARRAARTSKRAS